MSDYGHELRFGSFITPQNQRPQDVIALAKLSEDVGLDLVSFQDHPYQSQYLDTWTLLSWVAAQTERIHVSGNVLNLPLRPPAVLARAAASLDLLSGGRVELGLGAGGFPEPIVAMGGPERTAGESVEALEEGIEIIRKLWDTSVRRGVNLDGKHYHVKGAKRGPQPAHEIPIWVGALKPRMLRLVGRLADGWLPSLSYLSLADIAPDNAIIDEAAIKAERDPREIRRLLNVQGSFDGPDLGLVDGQNGGTSIQGSPKAWVRALSELVSEHGFSTFILWGDDPRMIETFATEVAPALREVVAANRAAAGIPAGEVIRGPKALALRHEGIDYDAVPQSLKPVAVEPGDRAYRTVRSTYVRRGSPGLVLAPRHTAEVSEALLYAREHDAALGIRSGGHGISGRSTNDGGIVIDLGSLNTVELIDPEHGLVRIGAGASWGRVAQALDPHGLAISSGDYGDVGVGGLATAGGIGLLGRSQGLTIDRIRGAEVVLADGSLVRADTEQNPELLWALRGAGGNFGIVTAVELEAGRLGPVIVSRMVYDGANIEELLERWGEVVEPSPRELTSFLYSSGGSVQTTTVYAGDDTELAVAALTPLLDVAPVLDHQAYMSPYWAVIPPSDGRHHQAHGAPLASNGNAVHLTPELTELIGYGVRSGLDSWLAIRATGGAINDVDPAATAYAHRHQNFNVSSFSFRSGVDAFNEHWDELQRRPFSARRSRSPGSARSRDPQSGPAAPGGLDPAAGPGCRQARRPRSSSGGGHGRGAAPGRCSRRCRTSSYPGSRPHRPPADRSRRPGCHTQPSA
jgi:alkanesulfonate monooxygenase SsuD/methylene tetrahydromethanopterin reductase-like flavin-dependent oxidoreductase (luciferase family)